MKTCALVVACALLVACGKKGPPLLPFVRQPKAAEITAARRAGSDVYLTIAVPTANIDDSMPASVAVIEVWAITAETPPAQSQFTTVGTQIMKLPVARYPDPADRSGTVVPNPRDGALQGIPVTIHETLTPEKMLAASSAKPPTGKPLPKGAEPSPPTVQPDTRGPEVLRRFYMTIPLSARGRPGPPSAIVEVPMTMTPGKVPALRVSLRGHDVRLEWEPAGGLLGWLVDRALPLEPAPVEERQVPPAGRPAPPAAPSGPTLYFIYRDLSPDPLELPPKRATDPPLASSPPTPINAQPQPGLAFTEDVPFDDRERCYQVRGVRGTGAQRVEGEPSDRVCIVSIDTEPPAAPTGLMATVLEGSIELRWEPNGEEDLLGYVVLRRTAGSDTLQLRTPAPIPGTRFTDPEVLAGEMYIYVVRAVDNRVPLPNVSDDSAETTATAR
jgi:hypothetical protein